MSALIVGAVGLAAIAALAWSESKGGSARQIWLVNGQRYALALRIQSPGFDPSMFPGFCEFSTPTITPFRSDSIPGGKGAGVQTYEVQFTAQWCAANFLWSVPENVAIGEV